MMNTYFGSICTLANAKEAAQTTSICFGAAEIQQLSEFNFNTPDRVAESFQKRLLAVSIYVYWPIGVSCDSESVVS